MKTIVLDTNCLLAILPSSSQYHQIWTDLNNGKIALCVTTEILDEYEEILIQKVSVEFAEIVMQLVMKMPKLKLVAPTFFLHLITTDPDDNKFVDCAFCGQAELIVTNDTHFSILKSIDFPKFTVVNLRDFKQ